MRVETPLATCSTAVQRSESATWAVISMPRFIGPGCITMACSGIFAMRSPSSPYRREYSRSVGKKAAFMRSRCTRSIITASDFGSTSSRLYETSQGQVSTPIGTSVGGATRVTSAPRVCSRWTLERATRLCRTSPTMVIRRPFRSLPRPASRPTRRRRMVKASSRAWVGCSWVPSPALTTAESIQPEVASR